MFMNERVDNGTTSDTSRILDIRYIIESRLLENSEDQQYAWRTDVRLDP